MKLDAKTMAILQGLQRNELTEALVYERLADRVKKEDDAQTLRSIAAEERKHADIWRSYTNADVKPSGAKVAMLSFLAKVLGYTFVLKKMENGEHSAVKGYGELSKKLPEAQRILEEEEVHEAKLLDMLDEESLQYVGSMVLGLSDALVELSGTLAGLTFALQNTRLIALSGLITGISATLSMASSEYLSAKSEGRTDALKSCTYTGVAYLLTVALMVLPYLLISNGGYLSAMFIMLGTVVLIILGFTYYISVSKNLSFRRRFMEMAGISLSVAGISFVIGILVKRFLGIDI